jgi:hypothetical protein
MVGRHTWLAGNLSWGTWMDFRMPNLAGASQLPRLRLLRRRAPRNDVRAVGLVMRALLGAGAGGNGAKKSQFESGQINLNWLTGKEL